MTCLTLSLYIRSNVVVGGVYTFTQALSFTYTTGVQLYKTPYIYIYIYTHTSSEIHSLQYPLADNNSGFVGWSYNFSTIFIFTAILNFISMTEDGCEDIRSWMTSVTTVCYLSCCCCTKTKLAYTYTWDQNYNTPEYKLHPIILRWKPCIP